MEKAFSPAENESRLYEQWESAHAFEPSGNGDPFSVVIPPPNVTGILHIGHALNITLQDILVRYQRQKGKRVLWVPGTDHAGIATQNVIEKRLNKEGKNRFDLGRDGFIKRVWEWKAEYGTRITNQIKRLGASVDWTHERFTMDAGCAEAVVAHFVKLYEAGLIYRGKYIINWCPRCQTALSDIEVTHEETNGHLWHIRYDEVDGSGSIVVATTRPETMFGDQAIAVHPEDPRYQALIGKQVKIPLTDRVIPVIADAAVAMDFGTGAVKVTPAHDPNDFDMGARHQLEPLLIMDESGVMNDNVPLEFQNLDRAVCRKNLVARLDDTKSLTRTQDHLLSIGHCYRCNTIIEPYLSNQWFIDMKDITDPAIQAVRTSEIEFIPKRWEKLYFDWMENIRPWCISRQIWWGHQIPVWYCECEPDSPIVAKTAPTSCPKCGSSDIKQDPDVLDTWFSSALWPFSTLGWPEKTQDLADFYPTSTLITGYDIITFWVSRMITMGLFHMKEIPFSKVFIHGLVRDISGKKMSKSLGNALDPMELVDEFGADAVRFSLASLITLGGQDIKISKEKIEASRNFANKVWNVSRYIHMILENHDGQIHIETPALSDDPAQKWILSLLAGTLQKLDEYFDTMNFAYSTDLLWNFIWNQFCDWYIELSKLNKENSLPTLIFSLTQILKMLHPIMPFITEEIWQKLNESGKITGLSPQLITAACPEPLDRYLNPEIERDMDMLIQVIREARNLRKHLGLAPSKECALILVVPNPAEYKALEWGQPYIQKLARISDIKITDKTDPAEQVTSAVIGEIQVLIPLAGLIDVDAEKTRLKKELAQVTQELSELHKKISNDTFLQKAPQAVVQGVRDQQGILKTEKQAIEKQLLHLK